MRRIKWFSVLVGMQAGANIAWVKQTEYLPQMNLGEATSTKALLYYADVVPKRLSQNEANSASFGATMVHFDTRPRCSHDSKATREYFDKYLKLVTNEIYI